MNFHHQIHPRTQAILDGTAPAPVKVADQLDRSSAANRINSWIGLRVTLGVGTMWCAYAFGCLALVSLPGAILSHNPVVLVSWISQTFLQLVLLSVIIVGQNIQALASDKRSEATYKDAEAVLHEAMQIQAHLQAQDDALNQLLASINPGGGAASAAAAS